MKNLFKQTLFLVILVLTVDISFAQVASKPGKVKVDETYSRLFNTFFMGSQSGVNAAPAIFSEKIKFSDKYFNHNLRSLNLPLSPDFNTLTFDRKRAYLRDLLTQEGIGRKMAVKESKVAAKGSMT